MNQLSELSPDPRQLLFCLNLELPAALALHELEEWNIGAWERAQFLNPPDASATAVRLTLGLVVAAGVAGTAVWWRFASGRVAAIALLILVPVKGAIGDGGVLSNLLARIVVVSILYYATIWVARNYRALRHQRTVNQHRHKAFMTFETFVQGGESPETRDAVLREATRCIFSLSATGYLGKQDEMPQSSLVEVVQSATRRSAE